VDPVGVVVVDVFAQKTLQVLLVRYDHVIKQLPARAADPTFRHSVLPRASIGGPSRFDAKVADRLADLVERELVSGPKFLICRGNTGNLLKQGSLGRTSLPDSAPYTRL
jgi:hypothetical protein